MRVFAFAVAAGLIAAACATDLTDEDIAAIEAACAEDRGESIEDRVARERAEQECAAATGETSSEAIRDALGGD